MTRVTGVRNRYIFYKFSQSGKYLETTLNVIFPPI